MNKVGLSFQNSVAMWNKKQLIGRRFSPVAFAFGGIVALVMCLTTVGGRLLLEENGTITAREVTTSYRPAAIYTLRTPNGGNRTFISGPTNASLPRDLKIGSNLTKRKWELGYSINGNYVLDFPIGFYLGVLVLGIGLLFVSVRLAIRQRQ